ncbi:hypothetical protein CSUI_010348, partial [Cystoisospora suis]
MPDIFWLTEEPRQQLGPRASKKQNMGEQNSEDDRSSPSPSEVRVRSLDA